MDVLIKCLAFAIVTVLAANVLKRHLPEISVVIVILSCAAIIFASSEIIEKCISFVRALSSLAGVNDSLLSPVLKVSAVAILARMGSEICKENGASSVAAIIELCASAVAIVISIPLLESVIDLISGM